MFNVGDMVVIESRTWPGINKPGGVAKVIKVNKEDGTVDVKYTLGGSEKKVEFLYAKLWDIYSTSSAAAARRSSTASTTATLTNSMRSSASNSREVTAPISHNNCRGTNNKTTKIAAKTKTSHSSSCLQPNNGCTNLTSLTIPRKLKRLPLSESSHHQMIDVQLSTQLDERKANDISKKHKMAKAAADDAVTSSPETISRQPIVVTHDDTISANDGKENRHEFPSSIKKETSTTISGVTDPIAREDASVEPKLTWQTSPIHATTSSATALVRQRTALLPTKIPEPSSKWTVLGTDSGGGYPSLPLSPLPPKKRMLLRTTLEQQQQQQQFNTPYSLSLVPPTLLPNSNFPKDTNASAIMTQQQLLGLPAVIRQKEKDSTTPLSSAPQLERENNIRVDIPKTACVTTVEGGVAAQYVASNTVTSCYTTNASKSRNTPWKKRHHALSTSLVTPSPKDEGIRNDHNHNSRTFPMDITTDIYKDNTNSTTTRGTLWKKRHHLLSTSFVTPSPKVESKNDTKNSSMEDPTYTNNNISTEIVRSHTAIGTNSQASSTLWKKRHPAYLVSSSFGTPSPRCYYH